MSTSVHPKVVEGMSEDVDRVTDKVNIWLLDMIKLLTKF